VYERLSKRVEGIVRDAHAIAREYEQEWVGTEHVLLAIARDGGGLGAKILAASGADYPRIKNEVDLLIRQSMEETWVFGRLPGTPHFKNVMARAIEAAQQLDSKEVCTEHLLLALLKEEGSVAYNTLKKLGIDPVKVKTQVQKAKSAG
jgi:ATP-dependent Clp protease ATP-binding subunit ClpC